MTFDTNYGHLKPSFSHVAINSSHYNAFCKSPIK